MQAQTQRYVNAALIVLCAAFSVGAGELPSGAQEPVPPTGKAVAPVEAFVAPPIVLSVLRAVPYDLAERGPLLVLVPRPFFSGKQGGPPPRLSSLAGVAEATDTRLVAIGQMSVLAPRTVTIINTKPGKANPFGDLSVSDTLKLLLSTFTPAQWKQVGGATGIGAGDLTDDQKILWAQMLPEQAKVQKSKLEAGDTPRSIRYTDTQVIDVHPRSTGRLRLSKTVTLSFYKPGGTDTAWGGDPYMGSDRVGETKTMLLNLSTRPYEKAPNSAYGVALLSEQSNRLKTGAVDFAAPVLDKRIALNDFPPHVAIVKGTSAKPAAPTAAASSAWEQFAQFQVQAQNELGTLPTVGDVLLRITKATGVEFVADKRVRDVPVYLRGESARTGDLLMTLALSVGGAFRKMEPGQTRDTAPLYVLTDDTEGIGARVARLGEWAEAADELKRRTTDKADEAAAKNDPLAYLSFAPGDAFALSDTQTKRVGDSWRKEKYGTTPDVLAADMSPALKKAVQDFVDAREGEGVSLQSGRVRMGEELRAYLLFPEVPEVNGGALEARELGNAVGHQYLQVVAFDPSKKPGGEPKSSKTAAPSPAPGFSSPVLQKQRRILIARPKTETEAAHIVRAAIGRGITEVWLETSLADPKAAAELLTKATEAGGKKIAVGALIRLLKGNENGGSLGEPDRNIMGETGDAHRARAASQYPGDKANLGYYENALLGFSGWSAIESADAPGATELRRRVSLIANVPNLAGLTFRATGGPGWTGQKDGGDALFPDTAQGYTNAMRRAFLRAYGIDPVDIPDLSWQLREIAWNVGYFAAMDGQGEYEVVNHKLVRRGGDAVPRTAWWEFRKKRNVELMASVFKSVRQARPALPLYIDDRVSSYSSANTDWFGSWDTPNDVPDISPFINESETREQARRTSKTIFAHWGGWWGASEAAKQDAPATFARQISASALRNPPPSWGGLVIDLSNMPGASVPALLEGLPKTVSPRP